MKLYLAYGANTNFNSMRVRCPDAKYVCNLALNHHKLVFRGVADVVSSRGSKVHCALWLITPECEKSLDRFEGFPNLYVKKYVRVAIDGRWHRVMFYVMRTRRTQALPSEKYEATLRGGYADCGINERQIDNAMERARVWVASQPVRPKYEAGQLPLPTMSLLRSYGPGRVETEAERERREEAAADAFFQSLYRAHSGGGAA